MDYASLLTDIKNKKFEAIYILQGEEPYFIDRISDSIQELALEEHERDFNQTIVYGKDIDADTLMNQAKQYPMMAERQLVIVKEAQDLKKFEDLEPYFSKPVATTVLVLCYKYGKIDARKKAFVQAKKNGIVFLSEKIRDYQIVPWISNYVRSQGYTISEKASIMLADHLGVDLSRIVNELDKLQILLEKGTNISEIHIEENIGISKDYNVFELMNAIKMGQSEKAQRIVNYVQHNPKSFSIIQVIAQAFNMFQNLMKIHFLQNKSPDSVASTLRLHPFVAKEFIAATRIFNPKKIAINISVLHEYDLKSKGVGDAGTSDAELLKELIYKLLH
jgi:DNA polymerase III subunit delta